MFGTSNPDNAVYALNAASGARLWRFQTVQTGDDEDVGAGPTISAPGINGFTDGVVYIDGKDGVEYALDLLTGAEHLVVHPGPGQRQRPRRLDGGPGRQHPSGRLRRVDVRAQRHNRHPHLAGHAGRDVRGLPSGLRRQRVTRRCSSAIPTVTNTGSAWRTGPCSSTRPPPAGSRPPPPSQTGPSTSPAGGTLYAYAPSG